MHTSRRIRRSLVLLLSALAFAFAATSPGWADDAKPDDEEQTATVVVTKDGTKTVRIVSGKDGRFLVEEEGEDPEGPRARMHVVVRKGEGDEDVEVLELKDGKWVAPERPAKVQREGIVRRQGPARDPMSTVLRWLLADETARGFRDDPLEAWFAGGEGVPLAGLRDALRADGWTAEGLERWFVRHLVAGLSALDAEPAPRPMRRAVRSPARGRWFEIGRTHGRCGACGCDGQCGRRRLCDVCARQTERCEGCGRPMAHGGGHGGGYGIDLRAPREPAGARRRAFLLWNDGTGWRHRAVDGPERVERWGNAHEDDEGMTFHEEAPEAAPQLRRILRELLGEAGAGPESAEVGIEGLDLLPPELLEHVPPEILQGVMRELGGMGLGELLAPPKRACDDCPKRGACKGDACAGKQGGKPEGCCGTCKGSCEDCPQKAKDGTCSGDCETCPNRKAAGGAK